MHGDHDDLLYGVDDPSDDSDIEGLERFTIRSVGIDIGSSTSHLVFSRLTLRRAGSALSGRFEVSKREALYRSPITLTPYASGTLMDTDALRDFFGRAYAEAGMTPDDVDTGAVVITGEALMKENAQPILALFAKESGKFICASAGPNHETLLAAYGSGAVNLSRLGHETVLNVDVGGGTSKLALVEDGVVTETASLSVGARLVAFDESGRITRLEVPGRVLLHTLGYPVEVGDVLPAVAQQALADRMADLLLEGLGGGDVSPGGLDLFITDTLSQNGKPFFGASHIVFSGGVSEYVYGKSTQGYGDVGPLLGAAIQARITQTPIPHFLQLPDEGIRATVIGAGEYTVQASSSTSFISPDAPLPAFALKVIRPQPRDGEPFEAAVRRALAKFDADTFSAGHALALDVPLPATYQSLRALTGHVMATLSGSDPALPLYLILDQDVAKLAGNLLRDEEHIGRPMVVVDGIDVGDLDYIDVGKPFAGGSSEVIPVTVKSLLFPRRHFRDR
ncbi:MAG: recombinase [Dehalococcoidia bacterium]|nr:recombinase [Dehalococcoidia bacterium]